jgi:DUF4097 and DUF4098 domain-containing protein YvlB
MCWGWRGQEHYERTESLSAAMAGLEKINVDTSFGEITIKGADTTDCNVTAKITGQAPTADEAKSLAEQTQIKLETNGKTLVIKAEKPYVKHNRSVGIAYDITVPVKTSINCKTSYGEVELKNIEGSIVAHTSFGQIKAENINGSVKLDTSYGEVDCEKITTGDFSAKTSFGEVKAGFTDACPVDLRAKIETSFGEIEADIPSSFAGSITAETSFGNIKTDLPITIKGNFGKDRFHGTIGNGSGKLDLKTSFGEVTIK